MIRPFERHAAVRIGWRLLLVALAASALTVSPGAVAAAQNDGQWWHDQWEMDRVWPISDGGGVTVAVLDSGVDASVPELAGSVVSGTDFTGNGSDGTTDMDSEAPGHGTTMATLITGDGGSRGFVGVAPGATILPIVVSADEAGFDISVDRYSQGIRHAVDNGAQIINISRGALPGPAVTSGSCPQPLADAIRYATDNDVIVVAATGNDATGPSPVPGRCAGVLTVGANDAQLNPWQDSHRSEFIDVSAPGVQISSIGRGGQIGTGNGTSGATALVSGAIALVRAEFPDDSADDILRRIIHTAGDIHTEGWDDATGYGVVQPYYALTEPLPPDAPNPVYEGLEQSGTEPTEGSLPGANPLAPADNAEDSSDGGPGVSPLAVVAVFIGIVIVALIVVLVVVLTASSRNKRRPPAYPQGQPYQYHAPPPPPGPHR